MWKRRTDGWVYGKGTHAPKRQSSGGGEGISSRSHFSKTYHLAQIYSSLTDRFTANVDCSEVAMNHDHLPIVRWCCWLWCSEYPEFFPIRVDKEGRKPIERGRFSSPYFQSARAKAVNGLQCRRRAENRTPRHLEARRHHGGLHHGGHI
jgi:hypothetical protein